jgi:hypothetical protein
MSGVPQSGAPDLDGCGHSRRHRSDQKVRHAEDHQCAEEREVADAGFLLEAAEDEVGREQGNERRRRLDGYVDRYVPVRGGRRRDQQDEGRRGKTDDGGEAD